MGNRAIITTEGREIGLYLHWNGGQTDVSAFLRYCEACGFGSPEKDGRGFACLCAVIANYFGDGYSLCIFSDIKDNDELGDNGIYIIKNWRIAKRIQHGRERELTNTAGMVKKINELEEILEDEEYLLQDINACQPEGYRELFEKSLEKDREEAEQRLLEKQLLELDQ